MPCGQHTHWNRRRLAWTIFKEHIRQRHAGRRDSVDAHAVVTLPREGDRDAMQLALALVGCWLWQTGEGVGVARLGHAKV